jgi:putative PIN family toxin of toxin-antitoxin system
MTVVLDTNVVLQARAAGHAFQVILEELLAGRFALAVSTAILLEYEEILTDRVGVARWRQFAATLDAIARWQNSVRRVEPAFRFHLITGDPDDDKFADCAIAVKAEWIVTEDVHFDVLKHSGHKPQPITPEAFIRDVLGQA